MKKLLITTYNFIGKKYLSLILNAEQKKKPFKVINERSTEYLFALKYLRMLCPGDVLDIGSGKSSWPHLLSTCGFKVKAIDKMGNYWDSFFNRHYKIDNEDITDPKTKQKFQFITCLSVLEHIPNHLRAMVNIHNMLEDNGHLVLTFPYNEDFYHSNIYKHPQAGYGQDANFITQVFSRASIDEWLSATSFEIVEQKYYRVFTGALWTIGKRLTPCEEVTRFHNHHLTCILLKKI